MPPLIMNDILRALDICLQFTPKGNPPPPGFDAVLFEFDGDCLKIAATDGFVLVRITLYTDQQYEKQQFTASLRSVQSAFERLIGAEQVTFTLWERQLLAVTDSGAETLEFAPCDYPSMIENLFSTQEAGTIKVPTSAIFRIIEACKDIMPLYAKVDSPVVYIRTIKEAGRDRIIVSPVLIPNSTINRIDFMIGAME